MKKAYWVTLVIIGILAVLLLALRSSEDTWIKDGNGAYVEHGNPSQTPAYVSGQQKAIEEALNLYRGKKQDGMNFSSQCLGTVGTEVQYAVDIVHVPRSSEDNLAENQCEDFRSGKLSHFIELDKNGELVKIV